jgi:UDP-glucuronate 4-epimerase
VTGKRTDGVPAAPASSGAAFAPDTPELRDARILVTGVSGLFGKPLAQTLAAVNHVVGVARFSDETVRGDLEAAGVETIAADVATVDWAALPDVDYVVHAAAMMPSTGSEKDRDTTFEVNVQATGRLLRRYAGVLGFLYCSSGSCYGYQGQRPLREEDPYGLHNGIENYAASKIAAESLVQFLSREQSTPTTIIRIFTMYGPTSGTITRRIDMVREGKPIPVYPDGLNHQCPLYVDDAVRLAQRALAVASVPPTVVNFAGSETSSVQEYCELAGRLLGVVPTFREDPNAYYPIWPDVTRMHELLGRCRTSVAEGVAHALETEDRTRGYWIPGSDS